MTKSISLSLFLENPSVSSSEEEAGQQMVNISLFCTGPDVLYTFPATEMKEDSYTRYILTEIQMCSI